MITKFCVIFLQYDKTYRQGARFSIQIQKSISNNDIKIERHIKRKTNCDHFFFIIKEERITVSHWFCLDSEFFRLSVLISFTQKKERSETANITHDIIKEEEKETKATKKLMVSRFVFVFGVVFWFYVSSFVLYKQMKQNAAICTIHFTNK